jgi:hypothetical protein
MIGMISFSNKVTKPENIFPGYLPYCHLAFLDPLFIEKIAKPKS